MLGFEIAEFSSLQIGYPEKPGFLPIANNLDRHNIFWPIEFGAAPATKIQSKLELQIIGTKLRVI